MQVMAAAMGLISAQDLGAMGGQKKGGGNWGFSHKMMCPNNSSRLTAAHFSLVLQETP